ncbi:MAG: hypothetical protein QXJ06_03565 [Candidatus Aenigmatarchaeota archaeon]
MKRTVIIIIGIVFLINLFSNCKKHISPEPITDGISTSTFTPGGPTGTPTNTFTNTMTRTATITVTATVTNTPNITYYHFVTDLEGWIRDPLGGGFISVVYNSDPAYSALGTTGSAQVNCDFYSPYNVGYLTKNLSSPIDLTGKTIKAYIYVPLSLAALTSKYSVFIMIHSVEGGYKIGESITLDTEGWMIIQYSPIWEWLTDIDIIKIGINRTAPDNWSGVVYIDEISW